MEYLYSCDPSILHKDLKPGIEFSLAFGGNVSELLAREWMINRSCGSFGCEIA